MCVSLAVVGVIFNLVVSVFGVSFLIAAVVDLPEPVICRFWMAAALLSCACGVVTGLRGWAYVYRRTPQTLIRGIRSAKTTAAMLALVALIGVACPSEVDRVQGGIWGEVNPTLKWVAWVLLPLWLALIQFGPIGVWKRLPQAPRSNVSLLTRIAFRIFGPFRWWKVLVGAAALVAASPFICRHYQLWGWPNIDEPFDIVAFGHVGADPADNAYELYRAAFDKLAPISKDVKEALFAAGKDGWAAIADELRDCLEEYHEALELYRQGSERTDAVYFQPAEMELVTRIPVASNLRCLASLARLEALRLEDRGDITGAWDWYRAILRSSAHAGRRGCAIERVIGCIIFSDAVDPIMRWSTLAGVGISDLQRALDDLRSSHENVVAPSGPLKVEYLMFLKSVEQQANQPLPFDPDPDSRLNRAAVWLLYPLAEPERSYRAGKLMWANWLSKCDRPGMVQDFMTNDFHLFRGRELAPIFKIRNWFDSTMFAKSVEPNVGRLIHGHARDVARRTLLETALALQIYKSETGDYPDFLEQMVGHGFEEVPRDPYISGRPAPIRYHRLIDPVEEVRVWSVGFDGVDNNGFVDVSAKADRPKDLVLHVTPAKRAIEVAETVSKTPANSNPQAETPGQEVGAPMQRDASLNFAGPSVTNSIGVKLVRIEPGEFTMGSTEAQLDALERSDSSFKKELPSAGRPAHRVRITKSFYLAETEITRGQFRQFVRDTAYQTEAESDGTGGEGYNGATGKWELVKQFNWQNPGFSQSDEHPVVMVSWNDAVKFCEWLSEKDQTTYRLPTEAEWEYACRAGTTTNYFGGDDPQTLTAYGNGPDAALTARFTVDGISVGNDGYVFTAPVRQFRANAFGLYDMHGNVLEWCADWKTPTYESQSPVDDPSGPATGKYRVVRGGCWGTRPWSCWSAYRGGYTPSDRVDKLGFRVAVSPSGIE